MKIFTQDDDFDEILTAVIKKKDIVLSDALLKKHQMLMYAATLLREHGLVSDCIEIMKKEFDMSDSSARNYLNAAPRYYCIVEPIQEANFIRSAIYARLLETRKVAATIGCEKARSLAYNQNDKNLIDFAKNLLPDVNAIDYEKFKPQPTIVQFRPDLVAEPEMSEEDLEKELEKLRVVKDDNRYTKYTEYEEVRE